MATEDIVLGREYGPGDELSTLPPDLEKRAREELNEDPATRIEFLTKLREKLRARDDYKELNIRDDFRFLIAFARARKFEMNRVYDLVVAHFKFKKNDFPYGTERVSVSDQRRILEQEMTHMLPTKDKDGVPLAVLYFTNMDFERVEMDLNRRATFTMVESWLSRDEITVCGISLVEDLSGMSFSRMIANMGSQSKMREEQKRNAKMWKDCMPLRMRKIILLNTPWWMQPILTISKWFMGAKMRKRIISLSSVEDLEKYIDKQSLPVELGGELVFSAREQLKQMHVRAGVPFVDNRRVIEIDPAELPASSSEADCGWTIDSSRTGFVIVTAVTEGSFAEKIGLKSGDLFEKLNGKKIRSLDDLKETLANVKNAGSDGYWAFEHAKKLRERAKAVFEIDLMSDHENEKGVEQTMTVGEQDVKEFIKAELDDLQAMQGEAELDEEEKKEIEKEIDEIKQHQDDKLV